MAKQTFSVILYTELYREELPPPEPGRPLKTIFTTTNVQVPVLRLQKGRVR